MRLVCYQKASRFSRNFPEFRDIIPKNNYEFEALEALLTSAPSTCVVAEKFIDLAQSAPIPFMHRLPTPFAVRRFRFASILLLLKWALMATATVLLVYSMATSERQPALVAMILMGSAVPVTFLQWGTAARARCPLCIGNPLSHRGCSKNARAYKLFGSYRLTVATSVLFTGKFRCPYCGEYTAVISRCERPQGGTIR